MFILRPISLQTLNDFRDNTVDPSKMMGLTTSAGALDPGTYVIEYKVVLNHYKKKSELSRDDREASFSIEAVAKRFYLRRRRRAAWKTLNSASTSCYRRMILSARRATSYDVSESIFRKYDTNPTDGVLDYDEIDRAIREQGGDRYILKVWNQTRALRLSLGHFMKANAVPHMRVCLKVRSPYLLRASYPSTEAGRETTRKDCAQMPKRCLSTGSTGRKIHQSRETPCVSSSTVFCFKSMSRKAQRRRTATVITPRWLDCTP